MKLHRKTDPHCSSCHGRGEVMCGEQREDGYWCYSVQCHCVEIEHDDEMKALLARVTKQVADA